MSASRAACRRCFGRLELFGDVKIIGVPDGCRRVRFCYDSVMMEGDYDTRANIYKEPILHMIQESRCGIEVIEIMKYVLLR